MSTKKVTLTPCLREKILNRHSPKKTTPTVDDYVNAWFAMDDLAYKLLGRRGSTVYNEYQAAVAQARGK